MQSMATPLNTKFEGEKSSYEQEEVNKCSNFTEDTTLNDENTINQKVIEKENNQNKSDQCISIQKNQKEKEEKKIKESSNQLNLSNFVLLNKIGMGSFGKVYKVKRKKTGKIYSAKISIDSINDTSDDSIKNLISEINIISKLNHPCILKYFGFSPVDFKNNPNPVIITELATNGSLHNLISMKNSSNSKLTPTRKLINYLWNCFSHAIFA